MTNQNKQYKKYIPGFFTLVLITIGLVCILFLTEDPASRTSLISIHGVPHNVEEVQRDPHNRSASSVRFRLDTEKNYDFVYSPKSGEVIKVYEGVLSASNLSSTVSVEYNPNDIGKILKRRHHFTVMSIRINDNVLRSYEEASNAWKSDNRIGEWFGAICILIALSVYSRKFLPVPKSS